MVRHDQMPELIAIDYYGSRFIGPLKDCEDAQASQL